jgi:hypothetical protein
MSPIGYPADNLISLTAPENRMFKAGIIPTAELTSIVMRDTNVFLSFFINRFINVPIKITKRERK